MVEGTGAACHRKLSQRPTGSCRPESGYRVVTIHVVIVVVVVVIAVVVELLVGFDR